MKVTEGDSVSPQTFVAKRKYTEFQPFRFSPDPAKIGQDW